MDQSESCSCWCWYLNLSLLERLYSKRMETAFWFICSTWYCSYYTNSGNDIVGIGNDFFYLSFGSNAERRHYHSKCFLAYQNPARNSQIGRWWHYLSGSTIFPQRRGGHVLDILLLIKWQWDSKEIMVKCLELLLRLKEMVLCEMLFVMIDLLIRFVSGMNLHPLIIWHKIFLHYCQEPWLCLMRWGTSIIAVIWIIYTPLWVFFVSLFTTTKIKWCCAMVLLERGQVSPQVCASESCQ